MACKALPAREGPGVEVPGAAGYRVHWRDTTAAQWRHARAVDDVGQAVLKDVVIDDWFFGVSAVWADGYESPVVFPGFAGSFERSPAAPAEANGAVKTQ